MSPTGPTVSIDALDLWEVRQALHSELAFAAEDLQRAATDYCMLDAGTQPASDDLRDSRAHVEGVLWLLDQVGMGYDDGARPVAIGAQHHDLLVEAIAHRAHAIRDELSDEFGAGYEERLGKGKVLRLRERYQRTQALNTILGGTSVHRPASVGCLAGG